MNQFRNSSHNEPPSDPTFFDRILERVNPHREPWDARLWYVQLICGRWLALRRIQRQFSIALLADQLQLDARVLERLEEGSGVSTADEVSERLWTRLAARLSFASSETAFVRQVIAHASGAVVPPDDELMDQVIEQLQLLEEASVVEAAMVPVASTSPVTEITPLDNDIFALLEQIVGTSRHSIDLADLVKKDSATVNGLLLKMLDDGLIRKAGQRVDPKLDPDIALTYYQATGMGQKAYAAEQYQREREQAADPRMVHRTLAPEM